MFRDSSRFTSLQLFEELYNLKFSSVEGHICKNEHPLRVENLEKCSR